MTIAIIQARMSSTRLPGKILKKIKGKPMLELLVERLRHCQKIDKIVIATSSNPADRATVALAKKINCSYFVGDEEDVLDRFYRAAKKYRADVIVRITGDCPLHDPELVDDVINFYLKNKDRYDYVSDVNPPTFPDGLDLWVFPFETLEKAWREAKLKSEREHVCPYIWKNPKLFRIGHFESKTNYSHWRWTVDDATDFEFVKKIFEGLYQKEKIFGRRDILNFLEKNPELPKIQEGKIRDEGYFKSLKNEKYMNKKILGLSIGQLSTACLMIDGEIIACVSEERYTGKKNDMAYPKKAIEYCLKTGGLKGEELDIVAIGTFNEESADVWITKKFSDFSIEDYVRSQKEYWYPKIYENKKVEWLEVFKDKIDYNQYPGGWDKIDFTNEATERRTYKEFICGTISNHIGVAKNKIIRLDHHTAHAFYAYFGSPFRNEDCLIFTADAYGDGLSATVSTVKNGQIRRIAESKTFNLARLYRYITLLLGMKPNEHEYKVMGLAPYAKPALAKKPYEIFKNNLYVDGLDFKYHEKPTDHYYYFKEKLEGCRFDGIAGGLQKYLEEILTEWVKNAVKKTGIKKAVFSGGIAMNMKAMKEIAALPEIKNFFVCPSGSDESLAAGVCYKTIFDALRSDNKKFNPALIKPLKTVYLGPEFPDRYIEQMIKEKKLEKKYEIAGNVSAKKIAQLLASGKVIGRCVGRMEFGARALGNRSILANPKIPNIVQKINEKIKNRDFWMPFTPSILFERAADYLVNPKKIQSPFMTLGFETTARARVDLPGALHPADFTARPQLVKKEDNSVFYLLIKEFENITAVGAVLNTSFNLHGFPIILSPEDALHVFENSDIDSILLNKILITKKSN